MIIENREDEEKQFKKRLKYLYKKINAESSLLWTHENSLILKRSRPNAKQDKTLFDWKDSPAVQTGYGEISMVYLYFILGIFHKFPKSDAKSIKFAKKCGGIQRKFRGRGRKIQFERKFFVS